NRLGRVRIAGQRIESALGNSSIFSRPFLIARDSDENLIVGDSPAAGNTPVFKMNAPLYSTGSRILSPGSAIDNVMDELSALVAFADNHLGLIETAKKRFALFSGAGAFVNGFAKSVDMISNYHGYSDSADIRGRILDKYGAAGSVQPQAEARAAANQTTGVPLDLNFAPAKFEVFTDAAMASPAGEKVSPTAALYLRVRGAGGDSAAINSIIARARSSSDPKGISVQLIETGISSDTFTGSLALGAYTRLDSGRLGVSGGELITMKVHSKKGILSRTITTKSKLAPLISVDLGGGLHIEMIRIKAGTFVMGQIGVATPTHEVTLTRDYYMSKYEITQAQWLKVMGPPAAVNCPISPARGYYINGKGDDYPVHSITWEDICNSGGFLDKLNALAPEGINNFRLPTEAEWEYACRAGTATTFYWGEDDGESAAKQYCWYSLNANASFWTTPHAPDSGNQPVGQKIPNNWGLYDMLGNAGEFCSDWYAGYTTAAATDPTGPASGTQRVIRSGSWNHGIGSSKSSSRSPVSPTHQAVIYGL
ncbi:MAG TPA: formylglycine-generating enzyme family protein, partial [Candidatus Wallbacteria bacterium]|nr:formylglycine-generating enzyme family protein [Candidatus Wallbacteria bacterium]